MTDKGSARRYTRDVHRNRGGARAAIDERGTWRDRTGHAATGDGRHTRRLGVCNESVRRVNDFQRYLVPEMKACFEICLKDAFEREAC